MAKLVIENLTLEQAMVLAEWFTHQGEQDCIPWFEDRCTYPPSTDFGRYIKVNNDTNEVTLYCR